jgi:hypothetical protein
MMLREAKKSGVTLPPKFWNVQEYKKKYKLQVIAALSLLKIFSIQDILEGLRCKEGSWIYSLRFNGLIDIINTEKTKRERAEAIADVVKNHKYIDVDIDNTKETLVKPAKRKKGETLLDKLEDIDADTQRSCF